MSSLSKSILPLLALILILTACNTASPTAISSEQAFATPEVPPIGGTPIISLTLEPSSMPSEVPSPTEPVTPTSSPPMGGSGVILFGSDRQLEYSNLYLLDTATGYIYPLTRVKSNVFPGPFSPDGTQMLFTGFGITNSFVGVKNADGTDRLNLSPDQQIDEGFPAWSPDGTQIVFTSRRDGNNEIYIMNADGTQATRMTDNPADDFAPAWSPDGTQIAFVSDRDHPTGVNNLYLMNVDGSNVTRLTKGNEIDYVPVWSPDGKQIAFRADIAGNGDIYLINPDGSGRVNLTNNPASDWAPAWSPDGSLIAFQTDRDGNWEIYVMASDGSQPTNLTQDPSDDQMPYWKPLVSDIN